MIFVNYPVCASHTLAGSYEASPMLVRASVALPTSAKTSSSVLLWPLVPAFTLPNLACSLFSAEVIPPYLISSSFTIKLSLMNPSNNDL